MKQIPELIPYSLSLFPTYPLSPLPLPPGKRLPPSLRSVAIEEQTQPSAQTEELKSIDQPQTARAPLAGDRWPILRTPDPERRIHEWLWQAVADRDWWTCRICHTTEPSDGWQVDHIIPWTAGGQDVSTNLRLTCSTCNQRRSNFADPFARPAQPIIYRCDIDGYHAPEDTRVWCCYDRAWETAPAEYARRHEMADYAARHPKIATPELTDTGRAHIEAARQAARAAQTRRQQ
jgi:5-methylcytosine-specific restriction endonuclease McrA